MKVNRNIRHKSDKSYQKEQIQALLRDIVILRDDGCILRNSPHTGKCGGFRKDGEPILQAEHLHSRRHMASFADPRLVICLCSRHHIFYKPSESATYNETVRKLVGPQICWLWDYVKDGNKDYKHDLKLEISCLKYTLDIIKKEFPERVKKWQKITSL